MTYGVDVSPEVARAAAPTPAGLEIFADAEATVENGEARLAVYVRNGTDAAVVLVLRQNVVRPREVAVVRLVGEGVTELTGPDGPETHSRIGEPDRLTQVRIAPRKTLRFQTAVPLRHYARARGAKVRARWELDLADGRRTGEVDVSLPPPSLFDAAQRGDASELEAALEAGADVNESDRLGRTALTQATSAGRLDLVKLLLARGAAPHDAMFEAAAQGHADILRALVAAGARVDATDDDDRRTALHWAAGNARVEAAQALLSLGANPNVRNKWGRTALDSARNATQEPERKAATIRLLQAAGAQGTE